MKNLKFGLTFLISAAVILSTFACYSSKVPLSPEQAQTTEDAARDIASEVEEDYPILTYEEIEVMPSQDVYRYYHDLQTLMTEMEKFQFLHKNGLKEPEKYSAILSLIESSYAGSETLPPYKIGNDCLIGGYWGNWTKKATHKQGKTVGYRTTCSSPHRCALPGDSGGHKSGHMCNPKYFTYSEGR